MLLCSSGLGYVINSVFQKEAEKEVIGSEFSLTNEKIIYRELCLFVEPATRCYKQDVHVVSTRHTLHTPLPLSTFMFISIEHLCH